MSKMKHTKQIEHVYQIIKCEGKCNAKVIAERMDISIDEAKGFIGQLVLQGKVQKRDKPNGLTQGIEELFPGIFERLNRSK